MAKDKSLGSNPVQAYHKKAKQAVINKSRSDRLKQRDNQLQKRRPDQVQQQISELVNLRDAGKITSHDTQLLNSLERDLVRINKLRAENKNQPLVTSERLQKKEQQCDARVRIPEEPARSYYYDPIYNPFGVPPPGMDYKEVDHDDNESMSSTTSSTARIPMPTDPFPSSLMDKPAKAENHQWERHTRSRMNGQESLGHRDSSSHERLSQSNNPGNVAQEVSSVGSPRIVYDAAPVLRDLQQESRAFVPTTLKRKLLPHRISPIQDPMKLNPTESPTEGRGSPGMSKPEAHVSASSRRMNLAPSIP